MIENETLETEVVENNATETDLVDVVELLFNDVNEELENAVFTLYHHKLKNQEAFYEINGVKIYSKDITGPESVDEMFIKVYGDNYFDYVTKKAESLRGEWEEKGKAILPPDKHHKWVAFVDFVVKGLAYHHVGNPIEEAIELLNKVDVIEDEDELKDIIRELVGTKDFLIRVLLTFSKKAEDIARLYVEVKRGLLT